MSKIYGVRITQERTPSPWRHVARWLFIALGVVVAAHTSRGISYAGPGSLGPHGLGTLALVVLILSFFNLALKPVLVLFTLPFVVLSLGLGLWVINACLFMLAAWIAPGFIVADFGSALWGAAWVSLFSFLANRWLFSNFRISGTRVLGGHGGPRPAARRDDDVIDV
jgi:putative membrane protein